MIYVFYTQDDSLDKNYHNVSFIPLSKISFLDFEIKILDDYDSYVFTSKNAIFSLKDKLDKTQFSLDFAKPIICVGESTKNQAQNIGFKNIKTPSKAYGECLFDEFDEYFLKNKTLFLRGKKIASNPQNVDEIIVYENIKQNFSAKIKITKKDILIFTSPMMVKHFNLQINKNTKIIAIGTSVKRALKNKKLKKFKNKIFIPSKTTIKDCIKLAFRLNARFLSKHTKF